MEILAFAIASFVTNWLWPVALFLIGLGLVIFVHELGHFLVAKFVGIQVDKFAMGFGPRLFGIKWGETDYCVNLLPLGGYVKMLGQEDFKPLEEGEQNPRSYNNKSPGARMAVISAGVIMNVIFAAVLFIIVGLVGKDFVAPVIGSTLSGFPASEVELAWHRVGATTQPATAPSTQTALAADEKPDFGMGLNPGDVVLQINDDSVTRFAELQMSAVLAHRGEMFDIAVERTDDHGLVWIGRGRLAVQSDPDGDKLMFGISPAFDTIFEREYELITDTPYLKGDRLLAVNGKPIGHSWQVENIEKTLQGRPVTLDIQRDGGKKELVVQPYIFTGEDVFWLVDGSRLRGAMLPQTKQDQKDNTISIRRLEDDKTTTISRDELAGGRQLELLDILGMIPRLQVAAVIEDSSADKAGLKPGDIIIGYGDFQNPTQALFEKITDKVADHGTRIIVRRDGKLMTFEVKPRKRNGVAEIGTIPGVDLDHAVVASVREGSPAKAAGLINGDVIEGINGQKVFSWVDVLEALRENVGKDIMIDFSRGEIEDSVLLGRLNEDVFSPDDYTVNIFHPYWIPFQPLTVKIIKHNPAAAVAWGAEETWTNILATYASIRAIAGRTVSTKELRGPLGIGQLAIQVGRHQPLIDFVYLMAFISATLAVMNFLPLPVFDGGHFVFLIIEKVRRKPVPVKVMNISQMIGLGLILLLFVALMWNDVVRIFSERW